VPAERDVEIARPIFTLKAYAMRTDAFHRRRSSIATSDRHSRNVVAAFDVLEQVDDQEQCSTV
jgi:hypothetical protein